jgi:hypothetical protein
MEHELPPVMRKDLSARTFDPATRLARYMDFAKFFFLLEESALYFSRADMLGDPFEGSYTKGYRNDPTHDALTYKDAPAEVLADLPRRRSAESEVLKREREHYFVSCWHMSNSESEAMWQLYSLKDQGIRIATTIEKLKASLEQSLSKDRQGTLFIRRVFYLDYKKEDFPPRLGYMRFIHKRLSFEHEKEVRAIIWDSDLDLKFYGNEEVMRSGIFPQDKLGIKVNVDLHSVIDQIGVHPNCPDWQFDLIRKILRRYNLKVEVTRSELTADPYF